MVHRHSLAVRPLSAAMSSDDGASSASASGAAAAAGAGASTAVAAVDSTPLLHLDDCMHNDILIAGANHHEVKSRQLSSLEKFYVHVAEVYQHQTLQKHAKEKAAALASKAESGSQLPASSLPTTWPFARMENKLMMARYQVDNIVNTIDQLLKGAGQRGMAAGAAQQAPGQPPQPPVLTLAERNSELYEQKMREQAALQKDQQSMDKEAAAAAAAAAAADAMSDDNAARPGGGEDGGGGPPLSAEDELAEFLHDEDAEDGGGAGDEVSTILDPSDQLVGGVDLPTRRNRLGALLIQKRSQYTKARDVLLRGLDEMKAAIASERKFLQGVGELAKYWTLRTVPTDNTPPLHLPVTAAAAAQAAALAAQQGKGGPPINPYQHGLPAGSTTAYPSLMIDYRLGTLDISLDRGKAWLYRNDAGDVFVDESIGKELAPPAAAGNSAGTASKPVPAALKGSGEDGGDAEMKDAESEGAGAGDVSSAPAVAKAAEPSWKGVSARLHRAQHQLLYKHLYNALMLEARDLRVLSHKEQLKAASLAHNLHAGAGGAAGGAGGAAAAAASLAASTSAASAAAAAFVPPPSLHTARPWSVIEITQRRIVVEVLGFPEGLSIEWQAGISAPFQVRTTGIEAASAAPIEACPSDPAQLPLHQSQLLCNQALCIMLEHATKNSIGNRKTVDLLQEGEAAGGSRRDPAVAATGTGASATGQEEPWPARAPSIVQFIVMAVNHWRLVREVRGVLRRLQMQQRSQAPGAAASLPPFRVKPARTKQPYIFAFTVLVGKIFVLDASIRGLHFEVVTRLPPAQPGAQIYATFGQSAPAPSLRLNASAPINWAVPDTIHCTSAQHFADVLTQALSWHKQ